jgi:hypothetical protein
MASLCAGGGRRRIADPARRATRLPDGILPQLWTIRCRCIAQRGGRQSPEADGTLKYRDLDGDCHTIGVTLTCGTCVGQTSTTVTQCVDTQLGCTVPGAAVAAERASGSNARKRGKSNRKAPKKGKGRKGKGGQNH